MDDSHLFYFNKRSLSRMFEDSGFKVIKVQQGLRPYRFLRSYNPRAPAWLYDAAERGFSALGLRSGLGVIARLDPR